MTASKARRPVREDNGALAFCLLARGQRCFTHPFSTHGSRHEATDRFSNRTLSGPHHRPPGSIGLLDHRIIRYVDPLPVKPDTIVAILRIPIRIGHHDAVRVRAAQSPVAPEAIKPGLQGRIGIAPVIAGRHKPGSEQCRHGNDDGKKAFHFAPQHRIGRNVPKVLPAGLRTHPQVEAGRHLGSVDHAQIAPQSRRRRVRDVGFPVSIR